MVSECIRTARLILDIDSDGLFFNNMDTYWLPVLTIIHSKPPLYSPLIRLYLYADCESHYIKLKSAGGVKINA